MAEAGADSSNAAVDGGGGSVQNDYPTIDPTSFDVVLCGTGLPESVLAAACAAAGKTVLHVDPSPFYGSLYSSIQLSSLASFLSREATPPTSTVAAAASDWHTVVDLHRRIVYSEVETSGAAPEPARRFTIDLVGPRVLYCADEAVDLLLRSGGSHHVEFKSVEGGSLLYWEGCLYPVPDSRQAIFKDTTLKLKEKNILFRFFKLVQAHIAAASASADETGQGDAPARILEEDLDLPFVEFLKKQGLPPKMRAVVLYAIAMADYNQDGADPCEKLITTREGIDTIALYSSSIGRFANAEGTFIYPMYGHGELPQAFCRCAAVKGAIYVLRMPVVALLMDEEKKHFVGARLVSGQDILCQQLIIDPSYKTILDVPFDGSDSHFPRKVVRGVCIISKSVKQGSSNVLVIFPPKSLEEQQVTAVRLLQLSSNLAVCPPGMFMSYLSTPCTDVSVGKQCIKKAIDALYSPQASDGSEDHLETASESTEDVKPTLIWSCVYVQEITQGTAGPLLSCPMPDEYLDYRNILGSTKKLFASIYADEEFLPKKSAPVYANDDSDSAE
ncbi:rab escort protein 1 [Zea mays]|uniref:Rab escort protein 1 n=2 Tax=Zea mays TaxID=4577 RepID=A0A1D6FBC5_MAIZE|nr:rab escort protein 1 [Zea mays]XP_020398179.1 rab escort protein 1 [Zea mays]XP_020398180.1 rab escort protein 1 [Zea mays]XP_020398181.1 rab escort protein 1 [Zea mays]AQK89347.1 Rab escort protein 1 [Zea mays]|eukprot:XP_020398178.1 rab escort protein 1 [Zea mays]